MVVLCQVGVVSFLHHPGVCAIIWRAYRRRLSFWRNGTQTRDMASGRTRHPHLRARDAAPGAACGEELILLGASAPTVPVLPVFARGIEAETPQARPTMEGPLNQGRRRGVGAESPTAGGLLPKTRVCAYARGGWGAGGTWVERFRRHRARRARCRGPSETYVQPGGAPSLAGKSADSQQGETPPAGAPCVIPDVLELRSGCIVARHP